MMAHVSLVAGLCSCRFSWDLSRLYESRFSGVMRKGPVGSCLLSACRFGANLSSSSCRSDAWVFPGGGTVLNLGKS